MGFVKAHFLENMFGDFRGYLEAAGFGLLQNVLIVDRLTKGFAVDRIEPYSNNHERFQIYSTYSAMLQEALHRVFLAV